MAGGSQVTRFQDHLPQVERNSDVAAHAEPGRVRAGSAVKHGRSGASQAHLLPHGDAAPVLRRPGQEQARQGLLNNLRSNILNHLRA